MKNVAILFLLSMFTLTLKAQNITKDDSQLRKQVLFGKVTLDAFNMDLCKDWYTPEFDSYKTDPKIINQFKKINIKNISIQLILGSWCHDSHREVPRFIKILKEIKFPLDKLKINALDTYKKSPSFDAKANKVEFVPTMIIHKGKIEIGRIIESPELTLEEDLLNIISKN